MNAGDTLLCLVDLQERLLPAITAAQQIVWNAGRLIEAANFLGVEVLATEQVPDKLGPTVEAISTLLPNPPASKVAFSSAACGELFAKHLDGDGLPGRHRVLLAGIETHVCVQQTAYDLMAAGFQVFLCADATGSRFKHDYKVALRRMESAGVVLTTTEAALFEWCVEAGIPEFKQISRLVKQVLPLS